MKFNLKSAVVAVVMAAASASSMAKIQSGNAATGGELVFYAFDDVVKASFVLDLGVTYTGFLSSPSFSTSISSRTDWTSYLTAVGNNTANTKWGVLGNINLTDIDGNPFNAVLTTARLNAPTTQGSGNLAGLDGQFNTTYLNALADNSAVTVNNSYFKSAAVTSAANWAAGNKHNVNGKLAFNGDNAIGFAANFYQLTGDIDTANSALRTSVDTQWSFNGSTLVAAPVPEPETYGMLLAGLALVGSIVRRRRA